MPRLQIVAVDFPGFIAEYASRVAPDGMFVASDSPSPPGTEVEIDIRLRDNFCLIRGRAVVAWAQATGEAGLPAGMALCFTQLDGESRVLVDKMVSNFVAEGGTPFALKRQASAAGSAAPAAESGLPGDPGSGLAEALLEGAGPGRGLAPGMAPTRGLPGEGERTRASIPEGVGATLGDLSSADAPAEADPAAISAADPSLPPELASPSPGEPKPQPPQASNPFDEPSLDLNLDGGFSLGPLEEAEVRAPAAPEVAPQPPSQPPERPAVPGDMGAVGPAGQGGYPASGAGAGPPAVEGESLVVAEPGEPASAAPPDASALEAMAALEDLIRQVRGDPELSETDVEGFQPPREALEPPRRSEPAAEEARLTPVEEVLEEPVERPVETPEVEMPELRDPTGSLPYPYSLSGGDPHRRERLRRWTLMTFSLIGLCIVAAAAYLYRDWAADFVFGVQSKPEPIAATLAESAELTQLKPATLFDLMQEEEPPFEIVQASAEPQHHPKPINVIENVSWREERRATVLTLWAEGDFTPTGVAYATLAGDGGPRAAVLIRGVEEPYWANELAIGTGAVAGLRFGYQLRRPFNEIELVLDLAGSRVRVRRIELDGSRLEIVIR